MTEAAHGAVQSIAPGGHTVAAATLAVLWTAEALAPMFAGRKRRLYHIANNLGLALLNAGVSALLATGVVAASAAAGTHGIGIVRWLELPEGVARWVVAMLLFDCWQYWWHRINHRVPFLWRFHSVHHADAEMDASSGVRFHTVEIALSFLARMAVVPVIGISVPQLLLYEAIALPVILFHHSNIRLPRRADSALRWLIVTPWMHVVHHSRWQPETDSNYSSLLSVWDRLFSSFRLRDDPTTVELGLDQWQEHEWRRIDRFLLKPLLRNRSSQIQTQSESETQEARSPATRPPPPPQP